MNTTRIENAAVSALLDTMIKDGIKKTEIDLDGDGNISNFEIVETALRHPQKYHHQISSIAGRSIPWLLDDYDASTIADKKIREDADAFIAKVKARLRQQGLKPSDNLYKTSLANAIYAYVYTPTKEQFEKSYGDDRNGYNLFRDEFYYMGMPMIYDDMITSGGLGLPILPRDAELEATALETIQKGRGLCTERSKVIFALFERAGLNPVFARMTARDVEKSVFDQFNVLGASVQPPYSETDYTEGHIIVGIPTSRKMVYFEPNVPGHMGDMFDDYAKDISLTEMFQIDMSNLIQEYIKTKDMDSARRIVDGGLSLGDTWVKGNIIFYKHMLDAIASSQYEVLEEQLVDVLTKNPDMFPARVMYCEQLLQQSRLNEAEKCLDEMPQDSIQRLFMGAELANRRGDYEGEREILRKIYTSGAEGKGMMLQHIASSYLKEGKTGKAIESLELAITEDPDELSTYDILFNLYLNQGQKEKAIEVFRRFTSASPFNLDTMSIGINLYADSGRKDEAEQYFKRYLLVSALTGKTISFEAAKNLVELAERFDMWEYPLRCVDTLAGRNGVSLPLAYVRAAVVGKTKYGPNEMDLTFTSLIELAHAELIKNHQGSAVKESGESTENADVPRDLYWDLAKLPQKKEHWSLLRDLCLSVNMPEYKFLALHAAWASRDKELITTALSFYDRTFDLSKGSPTDFMYEPLELLMKTVEKLPKEMLADKEFGKRMKSFVEFFIRVCEVNDRADSAEKARAFLTTF